MKKFTSGAGFDNLWHKYYYDEYFDADGNAANGLVGRVTKDETLAADGGAVVSTDIYTYLNTTDLLVTQKEHTEAGLPNNHTLSVYYTTSGSSIADQWLNTMVAYYSGSWHKYTYDKAFDVVTTDAGL